MKKRQISILLLFMFGFSFSLMTQTVTADIGGTNKTVSGESTLTFEYNSDPVDIIEEKPEAPNIENIVNNISSFSNEGDTVYTGNDVVPEELLPGIQWSYVEIELNALYIWDDHDDFSAGDIFVRYIPNYWIGEPEGNGWYNYENSYFDTETYQISDSDSEWYNFSEPIVLFSGWTVLSCMYLNVYDEDVEADGDLGYLGWWYEDPSSIEGYHEYSTWNDDLNDFGDADLALNITILDTDKTFTATNLTELFQPYLYDNDDSITSDPNGLFARVIQGYDTEIDMGSLCIQYLYYWDDVYFNGFWGDSLIHHDDYELVQVYLNFTYTGGPMAYRFVFDNHDEYTNEPTEWRDSMEYSIYELGVEDSGLFYKDVYNSEDLRPLLGEKYNATYKYRNLTEFLGDYVGCYGGVPSLLLTVETYNHQFAIGNTGGDMLGQYYIEPFTDDLIRLCYLLVNDSFSSGVHDVNGESCPLYAPFAYDVKNVFEIPYIHSNFEKLMIQAVQLQGCEGAKGGNIKIDKNLGVKIEVPCSAEMELPATLTPGEKLQSQIDAIIETDATIITLNVFLNISISYDIIFYTGVFESVFNQTFVIDFADPVFDVLLDALDLGDDSVSGAGSLIGDMLDVEYEFTPQAIGQIFNTTFNFHIDEIVKQFVPSASVVVDLLFEDFCLKVNPILDGYLTSDMCFGEQTMDLVFDEATETFSTDFTIPELSNDKNLSLYMDSFTYGLDFKTNWAMDIQFSSLLEQILPSQTYYLGTFPVVNTEIPLSGTVELPLETYSPYQTDSVWIRSDIVPPTPGSIMGFDMWIIFSSSIVFAGMISMKLNRKNKN
ncbi:MAG: hypothetical protein ACTSVU_06570 [Promethearchaeota archaeon]